METTYIFLLVVLALLAITDLIVGVSNDAVNFLNSAIGSKAISFRTIMIIVSVGIFLGAVFSSGMMEVARKGIFVPSQFYFDEIMIIFLAVMITDILLLDFFNTLGMPTSTTVSIVFELLGAAVIISALKILVEQNGSITEITQYINTTKATEIIVGILLSVFIAFIVGAIVQWISRLIFTFQYNNKMKALGSIFGGLALASIFYFILYKGLKGTPYYDSYKNTLDEQLWVILFVITLSCTLFSFVFTNVFKKNILVVVVGAGTFGLALAFAGNDLVNFIGVPLAAYHSFEAWSSSGVIPSEFSMVVLEQKVPAESLILLFSGGIMVLTLWFSKKAKTVTETTINLSRQGDGYEKFKPNLVARYLVRSGVWLG
ncbi:MAG TPA: phosphate:sodium symporter, partial [Flavobacteriaceae bacterium]|nr:phosphate:sodium symporter [Flavobacteriaceae bacterium]